MSSHQESAVSHAGALAQWFNLTGQVALVTGATRGIGRACALALAQAGAKVVGTATSEQGAASIHSMFQAEGLQGAGLVLDVREGAAVQALLDRVQTDWGAPSILVNNAGVTRDQLLIRMSDDDWSDVLETDLSSVFRLSKAVLRPMMKARAGRIINITSVVGSSGNPGQANYCAAKAGLAGFSRALAREIGGRGITVNCIAPGFIDTDMTRALTEEQTTPLLAQIPLGRLGQAADIAAAVLYLASPAAAYVTGTTLHVNGGLWMGA